MRCLEIQDFLCNISSFTLQENLKIDSIIKLNAIKYIIINFNSIAILRFCSIKIAQQAFYFFFAFQISQILF